MGMNLNSRPSKLNSNNKNNTSRILRIIQLPIRGNPYGVTVNVQSYQYRYPTLNIYGK